MSNTIKLKRGSGSDPSASDLSVGELAVRTDNGKIFTKKDNGSVAEISGGGGGIDDGDKGDITVSNGGDTFTIDSGVISTAKIADNAVNLGKLFQHNLNGFIATNANADCTVPTFPTHSGDTFVVHDLQLNRDSSNNDPIISPGSQATITFKTSTSASGAFGSILDGTGLQLGRNTEYVKLAAPQDQSGQASYTLTFPPTSGSNNQFLQTDGSGTTSWASVAFLSQNQVIALYDQSSTPVQRVLVGTEGMTIQGTSAAVSKLMFRDRTTANFLKFKPVDTLSAGVEFTLPSADGSANHVLKTDGSGVMSFGTIETASISDDAVTLAKIQNVASQTILGRTSTGTGEVAALSAANARAILNVENGATADQTKSDIDALNINAATITVADESSDTSCNVLFATDGSGSVAAKSGSNLTFNSANGLLVASAFSGDGSSLSDLNASNITSGTIPAARVPTLNQNTTGSAATLTTARTIAGVSFDGSANISLNNNAITNGAGYITSADGGNAATLDSLDSTSFLRSDEDDTTTGTLTINNSSDNEKLVLAGSLSPHIRFQEGTTNRAYIQWNASGNYLRFTNQETAEELRISSGNNGLIYVAEGTSRTVWHSGNDGSGSGLDADTLDGIEGSSFLRSDADDTFAGNLTVDNGTSTTLSVKCDNSGLALIRANGDGQGTGAVEVGQSNSYGGGIAYNGDGSPSFATGESADHIVFYRLNNGTRTEVFHYPYNSSVVNFNNTPTVAGTSLAKVSDNITGTSGGFTSGNASNLNSGTIPDARFPSTLPAISGANLTNLPATGGATGGGSDEVFYENSQTVTTSYTITNGKNAMAAGPITINSGVTVTVGSGETLTIV